MRVFVCARLCDTCVFRPGNLMDLHPGRLRGMIQAALADEACIPCHATLTYADDGEGGTPDSTPAICRGFFDRYASRVWPLRLAQHLGAITYTDPPPKENA